MGYELVVHKLHALAPPDPAFRRTRVARPARTRYRHATSTQGLREAA